MFKQQFELRERCKGVHCVDLGESFPMSIWYVLLNWTERTCLLSCLLAKFGFDTAVKLPFAILTRQQFRVKY